MEHNLTCEKGEPSHYKLITRIINRQLHSLILSTRRLAASYDKKLHIQFTSLLRSCKVYGTFRDIHNTADLRLLLANGTNILKGLGIKKFGFVDICTCRTFKKLFNVSGRLYSSCTQAHKQLEVLQRNCGEFLNRRA